TPLAAKSPPLAGGAFRFASFRTSSAQGLAPAHDVGSAYVGAAVGFLSQYMRVSNVSPPMAAMAAFTLAPFRENSFVEYSKRNGASVNAAIAAMGGDTF